MAPDTSNDPGARFVASSVGCLLAESCTIPIDLAKVRLQVQQSFGKPKYSGFLNCIQLTAREEGARALFKGITPALMRQLTYHNFSLVMYEPFRNLFARHGEASFSQRLLAGGISGGIGIALFNPMEVIKTQVQANREGVLRMRDVVAKIWVSEGVFGFWAGVQPNVIRTFLVCAAELGVYDEAKDTISPLTGDGFLAHLSASSVAGVVSACVSTPCDVLKTRLMNTSGGTRQYRGVFDAAVRVPREEGFSALYKGFSAICVRKVIWCGLFFVTYEQSRVTCNLNCPP